MKNQYPHHETRDRRIATKVVAASVGLLALAGCASNEQPAPQDAKQLEASQPAMTPEQVIQKEMRQDANAALKLAGSLLENGGGSAIGGNTVDNYDENGFAPTDHSGVSVVRNVAAKEVTVQVTSPDHSGFTMTFQDGGSELMTVPELTPQLLTQGVDPTNINVMNIESQGATPMSGDGEVWVKDEMGHLYGGNSAELNEQTVEATAARMQTGLMHAADSLQQSGYDVVDELPQDALDELGH